MTETPETIQQSPTPQPPILYGKDWVVGTVTRKLHGCFIINHDVFCHKSVYMGSFDLKIWFESLTVGDAVEFMAEEHIQGRNKWRATRVRDSQAGYRRTSPNMPARLSNRVPVRVAAQYQPCPYPYVAAPAYQYPYPPPGTLYPTYSPPAQYYQAVPTPSPPPSPPMYHYPPVFYASSPYSEHLSPVPAHLSPMMYMMKPQNHQTPYSPTDMSRPLSPSIEPHTSTAVSDSLSDTSSDSDHSECTMDSFTQANQTRSLVDCSLANYRTAVREFWACGDMEELIRRINIEGTFYGWQTHFLSSALQVTASEGSDKNLSTTEELVLSLHQRGVLTSSHTKSAWVITSGTFASLSAESEVFQRAGHMLGHAIHHGYLEMEHLRVALGPLQASGKALAVALTAFKTMVSLRHTASGPQHVSAAINTASESDDKALEVLLESMGMLGLGSTAQKDTKESNRNSKEN